MNTCACVILFTSSRSPTASVSDSNMHRLTADFLGIDNSTPFLAEVERRVPPMALAQRSNPNALKSDDPNALTQLEMPMVSHML